MRGEHTCAEKLCGNDDTPCAPYAYDGYWFECAVELNGDPDVEYDVR